MENHILWLNTNVASCDLRKSSTTFLPCCDIMPGLLNAVWRMWRHSAFVGNSQRWYSAMKFDSLYIPLNDKLEKLGCLFKFKRISWCCPFKYQRVLITSDWKSWNVAIFLANFYVNYLFTGGHSFYIFNVRPYCAYVAIILPCNCKNSIFARCQQIDYFQVR